MKMGRRAATCFRGVCLLLYLFLWLRVMFLHERMEKRFRDLMELIEYLPGRRGPE